LKPRQYVHLKIPSALVSVVKYTEDGFQSETIDVQEYFEGRNIVLTGFPGAFTPTDMIDFLP